VLEARVKIALRKPLLWTGALVASCVVAAVGWSTMWTYEPVKSSLPWLAVVTAILGVIAWMFEWKSSRAAALGVVALWTAANWWFVEGVILFVSFSVFGFV
jgi:hypothetical protein